MLSYERFENGQNGPFLYLIGGDREEGAHIFDLLQDQVSCSFRLIAVSVSDWDDCLSPWPAPPVFGKNVFGGHARQTLDTIVQELIPSCEKDADVPYRMIGGYSLAGLFSLWAFYETALFSGAAACSASLWFPGWDEYARSRHPEIGRHLYLSLGKREPQTRNAVLARVGDAMLAQEALAREQGLTVAVQWHEGGHFQEPDKRTALGFADLLRSLNT